MSGIDDQWQCDLVDMTKVANENKGTKFLFTCIDVFSKYAWVRPMKNKSGPEAAKALDTILSTKVGGKLRRPSKIQTDKGTEYLNKDFQALLREGLSNRLSTR